MVTSDRNPEHSQGQKGPPWSAWSPQASTVLTRRQGRAEVPGTQRKPPRRQKAPTLVTWTGPHQTEEAFCKAAGGLDLSQPPTCPGRGRCREDRAGG